MYVQSFYLMLQVMALEDSKRKQIIDSMISAALEPEQGRTEGNVRLLHRLVETWPGITFKKMKGVEQYMKTDMYVWNTK